MYEGTTGEVAVVQLCKLHGGAKHVIFMLGSRALKVLQLVMLVCIMDTMLGLRGHIEDAQHLPGYWGFPLRMLYMLSQLSLLR